MTHREEVVKKSQGYYCYNEPGVMEIKEAGADDKKTS